MSFDSALTLCQKSEIKDKKPGPAAKTLLVPHYLIWLSDTLPMHLTSLQRGTSMSFDSKNTYTTIPDLAFWSTPMSFDSALTLCQKSEIKDKNPGPAAKTMLVPHYLIWLSDTAPIHWTPLQWGTPMSFNSALTLCQKSDRAGRPFSVHWGVNRVTLFCILDERPAVRCLASWSKWGV